MLRNYRSGIFKIYSVAILLLLTVKFSSAQVVDYISFPTGKFMTGNSDEWKDLTFNDSEWKSLKTTRPWQSQGYNKYTGYAWYRFHVKIPSSFKNNAAWKDSLHINLAHVTDIDETYLNGVKIGKKGSYPEDKAGFISMWQVERNYGVSTKNPAIKWDEDNVIAVKVYSAGGTGGIFMGTPYINMLKKLDGVEFNTSSPIVFLAGKKAQRKFLVKNMFKIPMVGTFKYVVTDQSTQKALEEKTVELNIASFSSKEFVLNFPHQEGIAIYYSFTDKESGASKTFTEIAPYILTPVESDKPSINGAAVFGVHKGSPISYRIPASGKRPMVYAAKGLPAG
jgi:alpha-galactosidase